MFSRLLLATALIAAPATSAFAQEAAPQPGNETAGAVDMDTPPPMAGPHGRKHGHHTRWWRHHNRNDARKGFVLSLGDGMRLKVDCGDEPLKGCIDAVRPLLDELGGDMASDDTTGDMEMPVPPQVAPDTAPIPTPPRVSPDNSRTSPAPSSEPGYHQEPPANSAPSGTKG